GPGNRGNSPCKIQASAPLPPNLRPFTSFRVDLPVPDSRPLEWLERCVHSALDDAIEANHHTGSRSRQSVQRVSVNGELTTPPTSRSEHDPKSIRGVCRCAARSADDP